MPTYEAGEFEPPAPVVRARVRGPGDLVSADVPMLIDTGADVSIIPLSIATAVGAEAEPSHVLIQFYGGNELTYSEAELQVEFLRYRFRGPFLLAESGYGILGRNILNLLVVTLDGPHLQWAL